MARTTAPPAAAEHRPLGGAPGRFLPALLSSLRPEQWTKNTFVFAGVIFGGRLNDPASILLALDTFAVFCALSSAVYLVNDVADRGSNRTHPLKRLRPIAAGALAPTVALVVAGGLAAGGLTAAVLVGPLLGATAAAYLVLLLLYSVVLKHVVIIDVLTVAAGFVLRAVAGAVAVSVPISHWLLVCTTLLALFVVLSKRRHELTLLEAGAAGHRPILDEYSPYLLDQMISVVTASTVVAYASYVTSADTAARLGTDRLPATIPFVLYGIFRYLYLVHQKRTGGNPSALLVKDGPLLAGVLLWAASVVLLLYTPLGR